MLGPARHARQLDGFEAGASDAIERFFEGIRVI
jgi:hypothetical protein